MGLIPEMAGDPLEEDVVTHSSILSVGQSHGQKSLAGYSPWGCNELNMTEAT